MPARKYKLELTDLTNGDKIEIEDYLFRLQLFLLVIDEGHQFFSELLADRHGEELKEKAIAWHVCKSLPDTDNPAWQASEDEIERLNKVLARNR